MAVGVHRKDTVLFQILAPQFRNCLPPSLLWLQYQPFVYYKFEAYRFARSAPARCHSNHTLPLLSTTNVTAPSFALHRVQVPCWINQAKCSGKVTVEVVQNLRIPMKPLLRRGLLVTLLQLRQRLSVNQCLKGWPPMSELKQAKLDC